MKDQNTTGSLLLIQRDIESLERMGEIHPLLAIKILVMCKRAFHGIARKTGDRQEPDSVFNQCTIQLGRAQKQMELGLHSEGVESLKGLITHFTGETSIEPQLNHL